MLMAVASKLVGRMRTTWFFMVAMFMAMAIRLVRSRVQVAQLFAVVMTMTMGNMLACG